MPGDGLAAGEPLIPLMPPIPDVAGDGELLVMLIPLMPELAAAGRGQAVFGTGDASFEIFEARDVIGFFEFTGVDAEVAVSGFEDAFEVVEAEARVGGEGADNAEADALMNEAVEFGELQGARGALTRGLGGLRGLGALDEGSSHRASGR